MASNNVLQGVLLRYSSKTYIKIHQNEKKPNFDVDFAQKLYIMLNWKTDFQFAKVNPCS